MDRYTKMCSLCEPLQEACPIDFKGYTPLFKGVVYDRDYKFFYEKETKDAKRLWEKRIVKAYWLPTIEQFIGMLEEHRKSKGQCDCTVCVNCAFDRFLNAQLDADCEGEILSFKEYWLKLLAYERWGVSWNEKKEMWVKREGYLEDENKIEAKE